MINTVNGHAVIQTLPSLDDVPQFQRKFGKFPAEEVAWYATDDDRVLGVVNSGRE